MNTQKFSAAMGEISDKYINEALSYKRKTKKRGWLKVGAVAACLCLVLAGLFPLFNQPGVSPFVLTAYALESDNTVSAAVMMEGENIPVTMFEADNGVWGFVFSYEAENPTDYVSISIMTAGQQITIDEQITAINGLELDNEQIYTFFIPPQDEAGPFSLPFTMEDESTNQIAMLHVVIEQNEGGYVARVDEVTIHERKEAPPKEW